VAQRLSERPKPRGIERWLDRAPGGLYRAGFGWALGGRYLLLHHIGAITGQRRRTVLPVAKYDADADTYYVAVGFGGNSHWYRNLRKQPDAEIEVGLRRIPVRARVLPPSEATTVLVEYRRRRPAAARRLLAMCGWAVDGSAHDVRAACRAGLRLVALEPKDTLVRLIANAEA